MDKKPCVLRVLVVKIFLMLCSNVISQQKSKIFMIELS